MTDLANRQAPYLEQPVAGLPGRPPRVPILMYHEITAQPRSAGHLAVAPDDFDEQLAYLRASGYTTLTAAELVQGMAGQAVEWPAKPVVLTFDDGFADFHAAALPLLQRHGCTATLFVTTGWVADAEPAAAAGAPCAMLCWSQIEEASAAGIEIGAHSHHHPQLDQLGGDLLSQELEVSKTMLEDRLGVPVTGLAYPFGYSNSQVRAAASAAGYRYACVVGNRLIGKRTDRFALPRLTIGRLTSMQSFSQIVHGERLPPEFLAYRTMTKGWSAVRQARSLLNRIAL